jgi:outer membrane immunogenic protein
VQGGFVWGDTEARSGPLAGFDQAYAYDTDGWLGGVHAGFNWQANRLVIGLETDLELADVSGSGVDTLGSAHTTDIDWLGSLRARFGIAADRTLFYLTGGLAYGDVAIAGPGYSYSSTRTGWTLGGGIEHAFAPNTTARLEYRYTDLGSEDFSSAGAIDESDVTFSAVRAGVSWKF